MSAASDSISEMYELQGQAFEERFLVKATNLRRMILEEVVRGGPFTDLDSHLETLGRTLVVGQMRIAADAQLIPEQASDFETRLDNVVADGIVTIQRCLEAHPDHQSVEFQFEAARRLGIPME